MIKFKISDNFKYLQDDILDIKNIFLKDNKIIHNARNVLKVINIKEIDTVVKSFKIPNKFNSFIYAYVRKSKAFKSYTNAIKLQKLDINTPEPIAYVEFYKNSLFKESFFFSKKFSYELTMADIRDNPPKDKENILKSFVKFTHDIHQKGVWHVDFSGGNVLINMNNNGYEFSLVDINRMKFRTVSGYEGLENFNKFWFNENDLTTIAKEYALIAKLDEIKSIKEIIFHDKKLKEHVLRRRKLKALFKGKN